MDPQLYGMDEDDPVFEGQDDEQFQSSEAPQYDHSHTHHLMSHPTHQQMMMMGPPPQMQQPFDPTSQGHMGGMVAPGMYMGDMQHHYMAQPHIPVIPDMEITPEKRITIWNKLERRKISGNAAPMGKNLFSYLAKHPECEIFTGQDKDEAAMSYPQPLHAPFALGSTQETIMESVSAVGQMSAMPPHPSMHKAMFADVTEKRVTIWHTVEKRKISGNAAPMEKNLRSYLQTHPECEVYCNQDKAEGGGTGGAVPTQQMGPTAAVPTGTEDVAMDMSDALPPGSLGFESLMENRGIPIRSPALYATPAMAISPMSPVDSIASSFNHMDFSFGSQPMFMRGRGPFSPAMATHHAHMEADRLKADDDENSRQRSSTIDEFGVMGRPDM